MSQEIEIEYKNLLTKDEFHLLLNELSFPKQSQEQTNHYFETDDFRLKKHASALRIREKEQTFTLTLKEPHPEGVLETHDTLTNKEAAQWLQNEIVTKEHVMKQLTALNIAADDLTYYGSLTTMRREVTYEDVLLVLDYSTYNGHADYEFELEAPTQAIGLMKFNDLLTTYGIQKRPTPNKIERFFTTLPA